MARISTHVLDTARGIPAEGIVVTLHRLDGAGRTCIATAVTNVDGRTPAPLVSSDTIQTGLYELTFNTTDYFARNGVALTSPPFLGNVVIRFGVADSAGHYHVPLLLSPYGYSTYRGS